MAIYLGPNSGTNISTSTAAWVKILKVTGGSTISNITYDDLQKNIDKRWYDGNRLLARERK